MKFDQYPLPHLADVFESGRIADTTEYEGVTVHRLADGRLLLDVHGTDSILLQRAARPELRLVG